MISNPKKAPLTNPGGCQGAQPLSRPASAAVAACMRNEGPYVIEWLAYHRVIGFDHLIVATNDCTDGSDALLDRLAAHGLVTHLRNTVPPDGIPQSSGMALVFRHLESTDATWLLHVDADEFLNVGLRHGRLSDLLDKAGKADVIALPWLMFGDKGETGRPLPVLPTFTTCEGEPDHEKAKFKSLFRFRNFARADDHMPKEPQIGAPRLVAADGTPLPNNQLTSGKRRRYRPAGQSIRPEAAVINHYAVRGEEDFLMRNARGDGQGNVSTKYHLGSNWHRTANRNRVENLRILRHWPETLALMTRWRHLPGVSEAEAECLSRDAASRQSVLTEATRRNWTRPRSRRHPA